MRSTVQITLRGILWAVLWVSVAFAYFSAIHQMHIARTSSGLEEPLTVLMLVAPFAATGALIGRGVLGFVVGVISVAAFFFVFYLF